MAREATRTGGRAATDGVIPGRYALSVGKPANFAPDGWRWTKLTDLARLETGHTPSRKHPEYWGGEIPWIGIKDATTNHGRVIFDTLQKTNSLGIANSSARVLPKNTVCLSRTASVGYVVVMGKPMATSQDFVNWVCGDELDYRFLKYVLLAEGDAVLSFASGTTHQTIYFPEVKAFHICHPQLDEQRDIAAILGSLDDKIDLNRRMNETLEAMARAVFKSWFVDFDPVHAKAAGKAPAHMDAQTAALFPDAFGDDGLPVGWREESLDHIADFLNGLALQKYPAESDEPSLPVIKISELRSGPSAKTGRAALSVPKKYIITDGDVLFSWSGTLMTTLWSYGAGALNQHLFKVTSDRYPKWFYYLWVNYHLPEFQRIAASKATTMGHIQRGHLAAAKVVIPNAPLLSAMSSILQPLIDKQIANSIESQTLAALRDLLLPKLMSGELRLCDGEAILRGAGQ